MSKNQLTKTQELKKVLEQDSVREQFENALDENAGAFISSIIDLYNNDNYLQKCKPQNVVMEALKAATLKLPINKQLGFAYIVPYSNQPEFQIGYKGYIQLAMRTGKYRHINADGVPKEIDVEKDLLTGEIEFKGDPNEMESDEYQGYFAHIELINGFTKTLYMTEKEVRDHAKEYSESYSYDSSPWQTEFDKMAKKTVLRQLLSKYGIMSTEMITAFNQDANYSTEEKVAHEIDQNANEEVIDVEVEEDLEPTGTGGAPKEPDF